MMRFDEVRKALMDIDEEILMAAGFEEALIGYVTVFSSTVALYDRAKCIEILKKRDGMDEEAAEEFFEFNVAGAYVGEKTPAFAVILKK